MKLEPVIVVHGTFAQDSDWFRRDSVFCKTLNDQLKRRGSAAKCWSHLARGSDEFRWSGANSELERRSAGWDLLDVLLTLEIRSDVDGYHIISHSHGGNVVINALELGSLNKLRTVTFLGCSFIETSLRTGYVLFRSSVILLLVTIITLFVVRPGSHPSLLDFFSLLLAYVSFCFVFNVVVSFHAFFLRRDLRRNLRKGNYRCFAMHSKHDEAYAALVASTEVVKKRGYYAKMLMRRYEIFPNMEHWHFRLTAIPRRFPPYSSNRLKRFLQNGRRSFERGAETALGAMSVIKCIATVYGVA